MYDEDGRRRWDELVQEMLASGEVAPEELASGPTSLHVVWRWLLPRLRRRAAGVPVDEDAQPPWWSGPAWRSCAGWDDATHRRVSGVAHHLRQVLLARPDATAGLGEADTVDAGEPVVVFGDRPDVNPLRVVKTALADVWNGRADPDALARAADSRPPALPPELLYPTRLVLRLRAPVAGVLRRRRALDTPTVVRGLAALLRQPVEPPAAARTARTEHVGAGDWRAVVVLAGDAQRLSDVEVAVGAPRDEPAAAGRDREVRELVHGLLALAQRTGARVDVVDAVPDDLHAPRPVGRLAASGVEEVLAAVEL